jgi:hypothetical protein
MDLEGPRRIMAAIASIGDDADEGIADQARLLRQDCSEYMSVIGVPDQIDHEALRGIAGIICERRSSANTHAARKCRVPLGIRHGKR